MGRRRAKRLSCTCRETSKSAAPTGANHARDVQIADGERKNTRLHALLCARQRRRGEACACGEQGLRVCTPYPPSPGSPPVAGPQVSCCVGGCCNLHLGRAESFGARSSSLRAPRLKVRAARGVCATTPGCVCEHAGAGFVADVPWRHSGEEAHRSAEVRMVLADEVESELDLEADFSAPASSSGGGAAAAPSSPKYSASAGSLHPRVVFFDLLFKVIGPRRCAWPAHCYSHTHPPRTH